MPKTGRASPELADALTLAALACGDVYLIAEGEKFDGASAEAHGMADRLDALREQIAGADDLAEDHREEFVMRRRQPGD